MRLSYLQVFRHEKFRNLASHESRGELSEIIPRGKILDVRGETLADSIPGWSCFWDGMHAQPSESVQKGLAAALEITSGQLRQKLKEGGFVWLKRKMSYQQAQEVAAYKWNGLGLIQEEYRDYPGELLGRNFLGSVGMDNNGLSGLELVFEKELGGGTRKLEVIRDGMGRTIFKENQRVNFSPLNLRLTIDRRAQFYSEQLLAKAVSEHRAKGGMVVVQNPKTGDILAMASQPSNPFYNPVVQSVFDPGSTFKIVGALAVLEEHAVGLEDLIDCENGSWVFRGKSAGRVLIRDHEPYKFLNLSEILQYSSNIGMAKLMSKISMEKFHSTLRLLGFGSKTGSLFPGESAGLVRPMKSWDAMDLASASYGYGVGVTALQLVSSYSALANQGFLREPNIVKTWEDSTEQSSLWERSRLAVPRQLAGQKVREGAGSVVRKVASDRNIKLLVEMLERVVESGTGKKAGLPGYRVAGKTGTSQKIDPITRKYVSRYMASFCGFVPVSDPKLTLLVILDEPRSSYYGGEVAAPIFSELASRLLALYGIAPDKPLALTPLIRLPRLEGSGKIAR
ncbi:MAG: penicillin-binding protein 2 [Elusimicrobia bacterium]|nr:penicillin-binding protein 2 [Elusimicrobiota bacterium]